MLPVLPSSSLVTRTLKGFKSQGNERQHVWRGHDICFSCCKIPSVCGTNEPILLILSVGRLTGALSFYDQHIITT